MAKKKRVPATKELEQYRAIFGDLEIFVETIREHDKLLTAARDQASKAKEAYTAARDQVKALETQAEGTKHELIRYLSPLDGSDVLPLFDRMDESDDSIHGEGATVWRSKPISAMGLPLDVQLALADQQMILVGQLQDRVMSQPETWFASVAGIDKSRAETIVEFLNDFIFRRGEAKEDR